MATRGLRAMKIFRSRLFAASAGALATALFVGGFAWAQSPPAADAHRTATPRAAPAQVTVSGVVRTPPGTPLGSVRLRLFSARKPSIAPSFLDNFYVKADGSYRLLIPPGSYKFVFEWVPVWGSSSPS